jgi:hypothetical protein
MVRNKLVVLLRVESRLEVDGEDTMNNTVVEREIEFTTLDCIVRLIQETLAESLARAFNFLEA